MENNRWMILARGCGWFISVVAVLGMVYFATRKAKKLAYKQFAITIDGDTLVKPYDIAKTLQAGIRLHSTPVVDARIDDYERSIKANPYVSKAELFGDLNGTLHVQIVQRKPLFLVRNALGRSFFLDSSGTKLPYASKDTASLILIWGHITEGYTKVDTIHSSTLKGAFTLGKGLLKCGSWRDRLHEINAGAEGQMRILPFGRAYYFLFGDTSEMDGKLKRMGIIFRTPLIDSLGTAFQAVNVSFRDQIIGIRKASLVDSLDKKIYGN